MPASLETTPMLPGLSPVCGKRIVARFDTEHLCSDGGLLALREIENRLGIAQRLAACIDDPRTPGKVAHGLVLKYDWLFPHFATPDGAGAQALRTAPVGTAPE